MIVKASNETVRRVKRTLLQAVAGGALTSVGVAALGGDRKDLLIAFFTALGTVIAAYAQNLMEDVEATKDRRI